MFDLATSELLVIAAVALVVIGPKQLPQALRAVGRFVGKARAMAGHVRAGFDEMVRQAELEDMEKRWRDHNQRIMAMGDGAGDQASLPPDAPPFPAPGAGGAPEALPTEPRPVAGAFADPDADPASDPMARPLAPNLSASPPPASAPPNAAPVRAVEAPPLGPAEPPAAPPTAPAAAAPSGSPDQRVA